MKPSEGFKLSEPLKQTVQGETFYFFSWIEESGRSARGGHSYYVFSDGTVLLPLGGPGNPESAEDVYGRWQAEKV